MGKKAKTGKQRRDKFYRLAKEAGYRSRAAFKLIQLNKRFEFLQNSKAVVDLCAAPGGWMQVARQNMPVSSLCIGVDLAPIKPIPNCIALQGDITLEKTRQAIKKELHNWEVDTVLHDGAPNVGANWIHDAFQQNCLTLMALKLATQILKKNGTFVTKVFRSNDYHFLIETFEKLFKKVHVWKPAASRLESAEIFVVCEKYLKPSKVDPDLLDSKKVFLEPNLEPTKPNSQTLLISKRKEKKVKAEGYAEEDGITLHKVMDATKFIESHNYLDLLAGCSELKLDQEKWETAPETTEEVRECMRDIKVCGPRELRVLLKWRKKMRAILEKEAEELEKEENKDEEEIVVDEDEQEDKEMAELDAQIAQASADEKTALKKKKKKMLREKAKVLRRKQLKMIHENDPGLVDDIPDIFSLKAIRKAKELASIQDGAGENYTDDTGEFGLGDGDWETREKAVDEEGAESCSDVASDSDDDNDLIHTMDSGLSKQEKSNNRSDSWFQKDEIADLVSSDDEDDEMNIIEKHMQRNKNQAKMKTVVFDDDVVSKKKKKKNGANEDDDDDNDDLNVKDGEEVPASSFTHEVDLSSDEEYQDEDKRIAKRKADEKKQKMNEKGEPVTKKRRLTPAQLAVAEQLIYSTKSRRDLDDWGWNRYANNDENLPDWFVEDESKHYKKELPVTKEQVKFYRERMKELDVRPIKKVAEAKARKMRRTARRMEKAKKKAEAIVENDNLEHQEKIREMKKIYSKANKKEDKKPSIVVMSKGKAGRIGRPNGRYKTVDKRMKTELRAQKAIDKRQKKGKSGGHGRGKGRR